MKLQLSDKQFKRIAKRVKGFGAEDVDYDQVREEDAAHAEFMKNDGDSGRVSLEDFDVSDDYESGWALFSDGKMLEGRGTYWVLLTDYKVPGDSDEYVDYRPFYSVEDMPVEYVDAMKQQRLDPKELL